MTAEQSSGAGIRAQYKQQAAERGVEFLQSGMVVGLGTGSTATFATRRIARLLRDGILKAIIAFASLEDSRAKRWGSAFR